MPEINYAEWFRFRSGALPENAFHVIRFSGTEGLNTLFSFTIELASRDADIDAEAVLAAEAEFAILRADGPPALFRGYPTRFDQGGHFGGYTFYTVELRPAFWKLTKLVGSAVFLNKKIREAAAEVLHSQQFFHFEHEFRLTRDYPAPEFSMQYGESFYDYVLFRAEEQGIYFYFAPDGDKVIFADSPESHGKPSITLAYSPASGLDHVRREEVLQNFTLSRTPLSRQVVVRCYDWKDPNRVIVGTAEVSAKGMGDVYLAGENAESQEQADRLAKIRAEELACRGQVYTGSGSVPVLRPGLVFSLTDHYSASFNRDYMVTEISHEGSQEAFVSLGLGIPLRDAADHYFYRNSFTCIPSDVPYRPARTAPRAKISGVIRAFVDGAQNRRAEMDKYGRYKLVFPFDISGRKGGNASCWIRMAGSQAGKDSGLAFPLLPGTEVVVSFIDGDPDRPVITGALPNGESGSLSGPGNANISGISTAGGNRITIDDTDRKQSISISTAAGFGYFMGSGSPGTLAEVGDVKLQAASVGCTEIATAFKSVATGFKVSHFATSDPWDTGFAMANAARAGIANTLDAFSKKLSADEAEASTSTAIAADAFKMAAMLLPITQSVKVLDDLVTNRALPYGATISAKDTKASTTMQVVPNKAQLVAGIVQLLSRGGAVLTSGLDYGKQSDEIDKKKEDNLETDTEDALEALDKKIDDYDSKKTTDKKHEAIIDDLKEKIKNTSGKDKEKLESIRDKLLNTIASYENAKQQALKDSVISPIAELLPEIVAMLVPLISGINLAEAKGLGGVSIASEDSNVNIRAVQPVSVHSQGGILLDTKLGLNDAGKWGIKGPAGSQDLNPADAAPPNSQDSWLYKQGQAVTDKPGTDYIVAHTDTLGLFADKVRATTGTNWISVAPLHLLKSSDAPEPEATLAVNRVDSVGIQAKVAAGSTITLQRGNANGQSLELADDKCVLKNGQNVKVTLESDSAQLATHKSWVIVSPEEAIISGNGSYITCDNKGITLDPLGGKVEFGLFKWNGQGGNIGCSGVLQFDGQAIKIG